MLKHSPPPCSDAGEEEQSVAVCGSMADVLAVGVPCRIPRGGGVGRFCVRGLLAEAGVFCHPTVPGSIVPRGDNPLGPLGAVV